MEKFLDILKAIWNVFMSIIAGIFVLFAYVSTIIVTADLLSEYLKIEGVGILAFILVNILIYITYKKFKE